jgi:hypothetical protein
MVAPTDRDLLRAESQERVDLPDFQHLSRQVLFWHESIAALMSEKSLIRGFELSVVNTTTVRVTPDTSSYNGAFIVPEFGADNNQAPHEATTSYSVVVDINPTAKDQVLSGFGTGQFLHVYASVVWVPAKNDIRVFWTPPSGPENTNNINTRFTLEWQLSVVPAYQAPTPRSVRIGTIWWSGSLTANDLYQSAQMLFEGSAVEDGSAVEVPSGGSPAFDGFWQDEGEGTIPDFDRGDNRWDVGAKDFAGFSQMALREIQEIKSQSKILTPKHWEKPPYGLSLRAAQGCTFTIGEGTTLSEGNENGISDPLNPGYRNIGAALTTLISAIATEGLEDVCIRLKPGRYSVTSLVTFPGNVRIEIHGCGPLATELKITDNGKLFFVTNAASEASAGVTFADLSLHGTTTDNLIEVQSSNIGTQTDYRFCGVCVQQTAGVPWFRQTQEGRGTTIHLHNVHTDDDSIIRLLSCSRVTATHSQWGHLYVENVTGTLEPEVRMVASHFTSFRCDDNIGDIGIDSCSMHHINVRDAELLNIVGSNFIVNGALEDALGTVDSQLRVTSVTGVNIHGTVFRSHDNLATNVAIFDTCGRVGFRLMVSGPSICRSLQPSVFVPAFARVSSTTQLTFGLTASL